VTNSGSRPSIRCSGMWHTCRPGNGPYPPRTVPRLCRQHALSAVPGHHARRPPDLPVPEVAQRVRRGPLRLPA
jgi:hypothetical protein